MGLPVISTNWSGISAFLNERVGYPIALDGLVPAEKDGPSFSTYFAGMRWAQPSVLHLRQLMRHVYTNREVGWGVGGGGVSSRVLKQSGEGVG